MGYFWWKFQLQPSWVSVAGEGVPWDLTADVRRRMLKALLAKKGSTPPIRMSRVSEGMHPLGNLHTQPLL